jgi:hypothetical protein
VPFLPQIAAITPEFYHLLTPRLCSGAAIQGAVPERAMRVAVKEFIGLAT